jgi:hypothetical protein
MTSLDAMMAKEEGWRGGASPRARRQGWQGRGLPGNVRCGACRCGLMTIYPLSSWGRRQLLPRVVLSGATIHPPGW